MVPSAGERDAGFLGYFEGRYGSAMTFGQALNCFQDRLLPGN
jgi:hypothetical protein